LILVLQILVSPDEVDTFILTRVGLNLWPSIGFQASNPVLYQAQFWCLGGIFSVTYGSGSVKGTYCNGNVKIGSGRLFDFPYVIDFSFKFLGLTVSKQDFGLAYVSKGFDGVDGILRVLVYSSLLSANLFGF
jgi:hypothetical protein